MNDQSTIMHLYINIKNILITKKYIWMSLEKQSSHLYRIRLSLASDR